MTTEEKATELVEELRDKILTQHSAWNVMTENSFPMPLKFVHNAAIQCALIHVEEIIEAIKYIIGDQKHMWSEHEADQIKYWEEIKKQISLC